jgi:hypothetical protein
MADMEARAWWADVQHLREAAERRQSARPSDGPVFAPLSLVEDDAPARGFSWDPSMQAQESTQSRPPSHRFARRGRFARDTPAPVDAADAVGSDDTAAAPELLVPSPDAAPEPELFVPSPAAVAEARRRAPRLDELDDVDFAPVPRDRDRTRDPQGLRRTVTITGRPVSPAATPGLVEVQSRRPARRAVERIGPRPDRVAMWAVAMGLLLCVVAMATASHP